jgi:hypothetical protein
MCTNKVLAEGERNSSDEFESISVELAQIEQRRAELKARHLKAQRARDKQSVREGDDGPNKDDEIEVGTRIRAGRKPKPSRKVCENNADAIAFKATRVTKKTKTIARKTQKAREHAARAVLDALDSAEDSM